jgi:hypothetical protein
MPSKKTVEEAEPYINESIKHWKENGLEKRIISLSSWAEKWRVSEENAKTAAKMKNLEKSKSDLFKVMRRHEAAGLNIDPIQEQIEEIDKHLIDLSDSYIAPPRRSRKSNK